MKGLFKLAISLFLVFTLSLIAVAKPATAQPIAYYSEASSDNYDNLKKIGEMFVGAISAIGAAASLSGGAATMSGLAAAGAVVGGGAVAGIGVLGGGPAAVAKIVMDQVLKDETSLTDKEREAREVGRRMATIGAAAGATGAGATIAAVGSVAGTSAAGITSGLATIGAIVGGGMAAGVVATVAAPAVAAATVGYASYLIWKQLSK